MFTAFFKTKRDDPVWSSHTKRSNAIVDNKGMRHKYLKYLNPVSLRVYSLDRGSIITVKDIVDPLRQWFANARDTRQILHPGAGNLLQAAELFQ